VALTRGEWPAWTSERWLRIRDAAEQLNVCERTIRRYIAAGRLPATRLPSKQWRIAEADVAAILTARRTDAPEVRSTFP
jgi:excisionase family DNA binding protein